MADIFGISFSDSEFYLGQGPLGEDRPGSVKRTPYPFKFSYDVLPNEQNIEQIAGLIRQEKEARQLEDVSLSVVLPENYAFNKRVAVPLNSDAATLKAQARWELKALLPGDIASYKIIKTGDSFRMNNYEEHVFLAIRRPVLEAFQMMADKAGVMLDRVLLESAALTKFLQSGRLAHLGKNQLAVKIERHLVKCFLFNDGRFFHSSFERIVAGEPDSARKTASLIKRRYNESIALLEQLSVPEADKLMLLYWGGQIEDPLRASLSENFKQEINELTAETAEGTTAAVELVGLLQS